jgi:hypothetical protein
MSPGMRTGCPTPAYWLGMSGCPAGKERVAPFRCTTTSTGSPATVCRSTFAICAPRRRVNSFHQYTGQNSAASMPCGDASLHAVRLPFFPRPRRVWRYKANGRTPSSLPTAPPQPRELIDVIGVGATESVGGVALTLLRRPTRSPLLRRATAARSSSKCARSYANDGGARNQEGSVGRCSPVALHRQISTYSVGIDLCEFVPPVHATVLQREHVIG